MIFKKKERMSYDRERKAPALRCSVCTGEQVAGFRDRHTGRFEEVALIRSPADLERFKREWGVEELERIY